MFTFRPTNAYILCRETVNESNVTHHKVTTAFIVNQDHHQQRHESPPSFPPYQAVLAWCVRNSLFWTKTTCFMFLSQDQFSDYSHHATLSYPTTTTMYVEYAIPPMCTPLAVNRISPFCISLQMFGFP